MKRVGVVVSLLVLAAVAFAAPPSAPVPLKSTQFGQGPTIVFLHGMGSARMTWLPTAKKLLPSHRVVMVDLPGHGDSALPDPFTLQAASEAIAQALAEQKAESTIVVGQGVGGILGLLAASAHPERLQGLVLIDPTLKPEQPVPDQMQRFFLQQLEERYDDFLKMMYTRMGRDSAQGVVLHAQATRTPPPTIKAYLRELLNVDANKPLKSLKVPLLVLGTEKRWPADKDWATVAKQAGFDDPAPIRARRIAGAGPLVASEQPDSLAAALAAFQETTLAKK
jgi:pimeloyl-ACP methyl ester carboxylesterase